MEGKGRNAEATCLRSTFCSDKPVLEREALTADIINTHIDSIVVHMNLTDRLPGDLSSQESSLGVKPTWLNEQNKGFSTEEPSIGLDILSA